MTVAASDDAEGASPVHLIVLCHGLWGEPKHLRTLETLLAHSFGDRATLVDSTITAQDAVVINGASSSTVNGASSSTSTRTTSTTTADARKQAKKEADKQKEDATFAALIKDTLTKVKSKAKDADVMDVVILNSTSNQGGMTYDGIDWLAERVVREIEREQTQLKRQGKRVARFSIMGYSLGGLVSRFVVGLLESKGFFTTPHPIQARQLVTIATPHIGSPPGATNFGRLAAFVGARLLSRTGEQLYCLDHGWEQEGEEGKVGLLEYMARPGTVFLQGLNRFERIHIYGNAVNDMTVPFRTGCIEAWDPFIERPDDIDVELLADAPILTDIQMRDHRPRSLWTKVHHAITHPPMFLNPQRIPLGFPFNYLVVIGSPILFPTFLTMVILRLSRDSRKSRARIRKLELQWHEQQAKGESEQGDDLDGAMQEAAPRPSRIARLVRHVVMAAGEDNVESDMGTLSNVTSRREDVQPSQPTEQPKEQASPQKADQTQPQQAQAKGDQGDSSFADWHTPWKPDRTATPPSNQTPLAPCQLAMVRHLNDPTLLPRLRKVWTYYPDVTNCHAIIIARTLTVAPHLRGLPIVRHIVDDFLP